RFQEDNPHVDISVLVKTVDWAKDTGRRIRTLSGVMYLVQEAHAAGALPELDPQRQRERNLSDAVFKALAVESDPEWRRRLILSQGEARQSALSEWQEHSQIAIKTRTT